MNLRQRRRAVALVEFALVVPILLVILFGIIEFSVYGQNNLRLANATREGARAAATGKTVETVRERVTSFAQPLAVSNITVQASNDGTSNFNTVSTMGTTNDAQTNQYVRVTAVAPNRSVTSFFGLLFNRDMSAQVVMRRE